MYACAPILGTSGSPVRHAYPYPELLEVLKDPHTLTRKICDSCKTVAQYPGHGYTFVTIPRELCIHSGSIRKMYYALIMMSWFVSDTNPTPNTARST